jgi:hypothetical protein
MSAAAHRFDNALRYRDALHPQQTQLTPDYVLDPVREALGGTIDLDPCTEPDNPTGALSFYAPPDDGLALSWQGGAWCPDTIFCNPPYGKAREPWVDRCMAAGAFGQRVILLMPAATDTRIFQRALASATGAVFIRGRVKFGVLRQNQRQMAASHPSALIGWNVDLAPCADLGLIVTATACGEDVELWRCTCGYGSTDIPTCCPKCGSKHAPQPQRVVLSGAMGGAG